MTFNTFLLIFVILNSVYNTSCLFKNNALLMEILLRDRLRAKAKEPCD